MKVYLGSDHRGYYLKEKIAKWLYEKEYDFFDVGAQNLDLSDDYTKYASEVASLVANEKGGRGIVLCGSGVGVDVVTNKFDGIRASVGKSEEQIKAGRNDDDMNILVIAADYTDEYEARGMVKAFLETKFEGKERYKRRLKEIEKIEANN
jgi:ribose 5-phosphate isomerase B